MNGVKELAQPYFLDAKSRTLAVLVHGFSGSPNDMKELADFLFTEGVSVSVPLLAGHGRHWMELKKTSYIDWWKTIDQTLKDLWDQYDQIFLIGYSFGGNLCLDMVARYPGKIKGVITMGVSVFLRREILIKTFLPVFHLLFKKYKKAYVKKNHINDFEKTGNYAHLSTKSIYDFYHFIDNYTKKELSRVNIPALIIHSKDDSITHPLSSQFVYDRISSENKELLFLEEVNHNPLQSTRKSIIFSKVKDFIASL